MALSAAIDNRTSSGVYSTLPRMLSLGLALLLFALVLIDPRPMASTGHGMLTLTMLGMSAGFVHGVGFIPHRPIWKLLFGPWLAWVLMAAGLSFFL